MNKINLTFLNVFWQIVATRQLIAYVFWIQLGASEFLGGLTVHLWNIFFGTG